MDELIAEAIASFEDEDGFQMDELFSPSDIHQLAENISQIIAAKIEGRG